MLRGRMIVAAAVMAMGVGATAGWADEGDVKKLAEGNTQFACDLYGKVATGEKNAFFSPYSISAALGMTFAGARGNTEKQMADVLHFELPQDRLHAAFGKLGEARAWPAEDERAEPYKLVTANGLWKQKDTPFLGDFLALTKKNYAAELREVDFKTDLEASRVAINDWVSQQTNEKIKDLLAKGVLKPTTRLVLANAVYFKAAWKDPFAKGATKDDAFTLADGKTVQTPLMHEKKRMGYFENDAMQVVEIPYVSERLSMVVMVPRKADGLGAIEKGLSQKMLAETEAGTKPRLVDLTLPKFKTTSKLSLAETLKGMGMEEAFSKAADFSGMTGDKTLYIGAVEHQAYVDVNEEGTEAAAATAVAMMTRMAVVREPEPVVVKVDRPFLYFVRHKRSGEVLFMGRMMNPAEGGKEAAAAPAAAPVGKRAKPVAVGGKADPRATGYIVLFENNVDAAAEVARLEKELGFKHTYVYSMPTFKGFAGNIPAEALEKLRWEPIVKSIEHDGVAQTNAVGMGAN